MSDLTAGARRVRLVSAASLAIGNMIGVAAFISSGFALASPERRD